VPSNGNVKANIPYARKHLAEVIAFRKGLQGMCSAGSVLKRACNSNVPDLTNLERLKVA
jgi:hypothetical protein